MIVPIAYPPSGSGGLSGLGCGGDCGCQKCQTGMGDMTTDLTNLWSGLQSTISIGSFAVPFWALAVAGIVAAAMLMPGASEFHGGRRRR